MPLARALEAKGCAIVRSAAVHDVLIEHGRACGVALKSGIEIRSRAVALATATPRVARIVSDLPDTQGMVFPLEPPKVEAMWMKNTYIELDMLFIGKDGVVVSIAREATPMSETPIPSGGPVLGVLEIAGGRAAAIGAEPGDKVDERIFRH